MDIELYREFMALAAHKSFVSAARDLNMSQPSLSRHMNALANSLGCRLFYETRPLSLTAAGELVLRYAGKITGDEASMIAELRGLSSTGDKRIVIIDMLHTNALYFGVNEAASETKKAYPGIRVDYLNMDNSGLSATQMVKIGKVDVAFDTTVTDVPVGTFEADEALKAILVPEFHGELVLGVSKESPLAGDGGVNLADLSEARFILQANRYSENFRTDFIRICSEVGFYPNITLVPVSNPLEFYSRDPGDGIHLLSRVDRRYQPLIATLLKQHVSILEFRDKKRYVNAYALMRKDLNRPELRYFSEQLEAHARRLEEASSQRATDV